MRRSAGPPSERALGSHVRMCPRGCRARRHRRIVRLIDGKLLASACRVYRHRNPKAGCAITADGAGSCEVKLQVLAHGISSVNARTSTTRAPRYGSFTPRPDVELHLARHRISHRLLSTEATRARVTLLTPAGHGAVYPPVTLGLMQARADRRWG
ncbi:hypothetical protein HYPSUDRAFT_895188 [Hypholoma sublateritium FD-334 SS-4]|uniref:Uncharacterized protein n=1 Tax=Hypholoma sublateritium (strain FD-334 SS-4) TaxID=945553 RepID=A0A0D2NRI1_HYPSF|nr:hypothetical protein HYPSUDRAFT_895188 [Hypholoma sublateritium FD-334 SS-4]